MNIFELYESLPPSTLAETARRMGISAASVRSRLRNFPVDFAAWRVAREVTASLEERAGGVSSAIETLLATDTSATNERPD